jgi:hypothetical protein
MSGIIKSVRLILILFFLALFAGAGCASTKRHFIASKKQQALCDLSRLGKNKYYYSKPYHRKLHHTERRIEMR